MLDVERTCSLTDHIAYLAVHSRAVASCCTVLFFKICGKNNEKIGGVSMFVGHAGGYQITMREGIPELFLAPKDPLGWGP